MGSISNKDIKRRILEISYKNGLSHCGSCITASDIIEEIYDRKKSDEKFVLSSGHAGVALYVVLEKHGFIRDAEKLLKDSGIHPDKLVNNFIDCSTGSLGHGIGVGVGMALADRTRNAYVLMSDGELAEGSVSEALRVADELQLTNLMIYVNWNGYGAYKTTETHYAPGSAFYKMYERRTNVDYMPEWLHGLNGHYVVMDEQKYKEALEALK